MKPKLTTNKTNCKHKPVYRHDYVCGYMYFVVVARRRVAWMEFTASNMTRTARELLNAISVSVVVSADEIDTKPKPNPH